MRVKNLHLGFNIFLLLCSVVLVLSILWSLIVSEDKSSSQTEQSGMQLVQAAEPPSQRLNWRWFSQGITSADISNEVTAAEEALAEASIDAELIGVVRTEEFATATIKVNGRAEKVFTIGDELQNGVELVSIGSSRVILDERGRRVQISMRKPNNMPIRLSNPRAGGSSGESFSLANMFNAVPVQLESYGTGFKLDGISEELRSLTEIQEGDVVVQVGANSIQELMSNPAQWMKYTTETTLPVTVMRDGEEATLYVNAFSLSARLLPNLTTELMQ